MTAALRFIARFCGYQKCTHIKLDLDTAQPGNLRNGLDNIKAITFR